MKAACRFAARRLRETPGYWISLTVVNSLTVGLTPSSELLSTVISPEAVTVRNLRRKFLSWVLLEIV